MLTKHVQITKKCNYLELEIHKKLYIQQNYLAYIHETFDQWDLYSHKK